LTFKITLGLSGPVPGKLLSYFKSIQLFQNRRHCLKNRAMTAKKAVSTTL